MVEAELSFAESLQDIMQVWSELWGAWKTELFQNKTKKLCYFVCGLKPADCPTFEAVMGESLSLC